MSSITPPAEKVKNDIKTPIEQDKSCESKLSVTIKPSPILEGAQEVDFPPTE